MAYGEEVFLIISLKTVFENLNLVKSYDKTNPNVFVFCLWEKYRWGLTSFGQYIYQLVWYIPSMVRFVLKCGLFCPKM